jgi:hypothetical protein
MPHVTAAPTATLWVSIGLVAAVVLVTVCLLARARGRRLERRMAAELGRRWDEHRPSWSDGVLVPAGGGDVVGGEDPDAELRITLDDLLGQRDALLEEFQEVQARIRILKREVERRRHLAAVAADEKDMAVNLPEEWRR